MSPKSPVLDNVIKAVQKLSRDNGERENLFFFIQSCYCGHVREYDLDVALRSLARLTEEEEYSLIAWIVANDETNEQRIRG